jgi:pimeloyl-ACP methyl ester carboxylesterase
VLVLMAERDDVVPHEHTFKLIDAWAGDKQVVHILGSDHCDIQLNAQSWRAVRKFLRDRLGHASGETTIADDTAVARS